MTTFASPAIAAPERARHFASLRHGAQAYNEEVPYVVHLEAVVAVLKRFGFSDPLIECGGWLHDVIEDTGTNYNAIKERFGVDVAELVYAVTSELGRNRQERNEKTYPKIRGNTNATALKLADRIANVEYGLANGGTMFGKYQKEYPGFKKAIRFQDDEDARVTHMWEHLDRLFAA